MIVMKFGGTSVESAAAIERIAGIVKARRERRPVVVVSAMGKTTNKLLAIAAAAIAGTARIHPPDPGPARLPFARARLVTPLDQRAELDRTLDEHFQELTELVKGLAVLGELTPRSIGRHLQLRRAALQRNRDAGVPALRHERRASRFTPGDCHDKRHTQAAPDFPETYARLEATIPAMARENVVVMAGFIGSTKDGVTTTTGPRRLRFHSLDCGRGIGAERSRSGPTWTACSPPTPPSSPAAIASKPFLRGSRRAGLFRRQGAAPATVLPAIQKSIPVLILNSRRPDVPGTAHRGRSRPCANVVKSIACKRKIALVNIHSTRCSWRTAFLRRIFEVFDRFETPGRHGGHLRSQRLAHHRQSRAPRRHRGRAGAIRRGRYREGPGDCLPVGDNIRRTPGVARRVFNALDGINIRMISQGASAAQHQPGGGRGGPAPRGPALHEEFFNRAGSGRVRTKEAAHA